MYKEGFRPEGFVLTRVISDQDVVENLDPGWGGGMRRGSRDSRWSGRALSGRGTTLVFLVMKIMQMLMSKHF